MTANVRLLKGLVVVCCLWHITSSKAEASAVYSDDFRDHYPTRGRRFDLNFYQLEAPVVVWDVSHEKKITVLRTRGDKYGYEQQKCVMTIERKGVERPRFLSVLGFRSIETSWVTGKLVLIKLDIGHVAGVDAIYDAEKDKLVYCESATYLTSTNEDAYRPENLRQADEARPPSPVAEATGPGGGTKQADGTRAALSNSVPLYVHFGVGFEPSKRLLYTRIHLGEPIFVGGDDFWELTGEIEERGTNLVADLKGSDGVQAGFYRGTVTPERAVHVQGGIFSGGVYSMWFVVSTNTDSQPVLQRVEEMAKRMFGR